jgi:sugar lactone lactonase YvrE
VLKYDASPTGLIGPKGIAIDGTAGATSGNVWIADPPTNSVFLLSSAGTLLNTFTGLNGPVSIAIDSTGNAWVANLTGNSVTELSYAGGTPTVLQSGLTAGGTISGPTGVAVDKSGNILVANGGNGNVVKLTNAGAVATGSPFTDVALQGTTSVAVDLSNNVWATGSTTGTAVAGAVSQFSSSGVAASYSPLANGGLSLPGGSAIAGTSLWVTNGQTAGTLSQLVLGQSSPSSPSTGFGSLNAPAGVAVDASGDVWTADAGDNTVSQFIGLATPVATPLSAVGNVGP